jgi:preprotein translocase subunit YajC
MLATPAYAQAAGAAASNGGGLAAFLQIAPLILIFVVFYFLMIRPQQQRMRKLQNAIADVKKNDQIVTSGGMIAKVTKVEDAHVEAEIAPNVRARFVKATIAEVIPAGGTKPAND